MKRRRAKSRTGSWNVEEGGGGRKRMRERGEDKWTEERKRSSGEKERCQRRTSREKNDRG